MYKGIFYLILVLLLVNVAPDATSPLLPTAPSSAALLSLFGYALVLLLARWRGEAWALPSALIFLVCHHFVWVGHRIYADLLPFSVSRACFSAASVVLFFLPLFLQRRSRSQRVPSLVQFLLPFVVPMLVFEGTYDMLASIPAERVQELVQADGATPFGMLVFTGATAVFVMGMLAFMPPLLQWMWGCTPVPASTLTFELDRLCQRLKFRHAGFREWHVLRNGMTAAILGAFPRLRYILFTERLIKQAPTPEIEAILAHEIGHSYHRHLLWYPLIIVGMALLTSVLSLYIVDPVLMVLALFDLRSPSPFWNALGTLFLVVSMGGFVLLYFRYVFGFFSRRFERQADLHIFRAGLSGQVLCDALMRVALANGIDPNATNWHHYGIRERIDTIQAAIKDPTLIDQHHRSVHRVLAGYVVILLLAVTWTVGIYLPIRPIERAHNAFRNSIERTLSHGPRQALARERVALLGLEAPDAETILMNSALRPSAAWEPGVLEFYAAQSFAARQLWTDAARCMSAAWERTDLDNAAPEVLEAYEALHSIITEALPESQLGT